MPESPKSTASVELFRLPARSRTLPVVQENDCVVALRALAEDTRVRIVGLLMDEPLDVGEIARRLHVSPYNVSKHLRILREAALLEVRKTGRKHRYAVRDAIRRQAQETGVLDLGCCSFQFDDVAGGERPAVRSDRKRSAKATARLAR
jgi:DNA-binding transcriptional ArsR family regulator